MSCAYIYTANKCTAIATQYLDQPSWRWRCKKHKNHVGLVHNLGRGKSLPWDTIHIISSQTTIKWCQECKIQAKGAFYEAGHGILEDYYVVDIELIQRECLKGNHLRIIDIRNRRLSLIQETLTEARVPMDLMHIVIDYADAKVK